MSIEATIEEVVPFTAYQNIVYQHRVLLRPDTDVRFSALDTDLTVDPTFVGSRQSVRIRAWILESIDRCTKPRMAVIPSENEEWKNHRVEGVIDSIEETNGKTQMEIQVHDGTVQLLSDSDDTAELATGDGISVIAGRIDIVGIEGKEPMEKPLPRESY